MKARNIRLICFLTVLTGSLSANFSEATTIDLQVFYTSGAMDYEGSHNAMFSRILSDISFSNQVFDDSAVGVDLHLVNVEHRPEKDYYDDSSCINSWGMSADSFAHQRRTVFGADLCHSYTDCNLNGICGVSPISDPASANSIACSQFIYTHEIGHSLGAGHERGNSSPDGEYEYSHGYRFWADSEQYRTMMAYPPGDRIPYFSNPNLSYEGEPLGIPAGDPDSADNSLTIENYKSTAAASRATYFWHGAATLLHGGRALPWLGDFNAWDWDDRYIYHEALEWCYVPETSTWQSLWMYSQKFNCWVYTQESFYPGSPYFRAAEVHDGSPGAPWWYSW